MVSTLALIVGATLLSIVLAAQDAPANVTITSWQYCQGCKTTVEIYAKVAAKELKKLDSLPKGQEKVLDAAKVVDHLCDNELFRPYGNFASFSCIKVLDGENRVQFLQEFAGSTTIESMLNKKNLVERKKKICVDHAKACKAAIFDDSTLVGKKRNKCAACTIIANDIDTAKRARNASTVSLRSILEDDENLFCDKLGYEHTPYGWLESLCEEMMEERLESILEVIAFHDQVASTGFTPDQTMPQMMCEEFFGCDKDLEQTKKPKKPSKGKKGNSKAEGKLGKAGKAKLDKSRQDL